MARRSNQEAPIIIKRVKKGGGDHHGGNWKVALADFMTSMFIFTLVMWLLNITPSEQKVGTSDFVDVISPSDTPSSGSGILNQGESILDLNPDGVPTFMPTRAANIDLDDPLEDILDEAAQAGLTEDELAILLANWEQAQLARAEQSVRDIAENVGQGFAPEQLQIQQSEDGLKITLKDLDGKPMFASGSATPLPPLRGFLASVVPELKAAETAIRISGHTDAKPFSGGSRGYSNWELSADRANATRRVLVQNGLSPERIFKVSGSAANEPLNIADPNAAENRRIEITLLRNYSNNVNTGLSGGRPSDALGAIDALTNATSTLNTPTQRPGSTPAPQPSLEAPVPLIQ